MDEMIETIRKHYEQCTDDVERKDLEDALHRLIRWHQMETGS